MIFLNQVASFGLYIRQFHLYYRWCYSSWQLKWLWETTHTRECDVTAIDPFPELLFSLVVKNPYDPRSQIPFKILPKQRTLRVLWDFVSGPIVVIADIRRHLKSDGTTGPDHRLNFQKNSYSSKPSWFCLFYCRRYFPFISNYRVVPKRTRLPSIFVLWISPQKNRRRNPDLNEAQQPFLKLCCFLVYRQPKAEYSPTAILLPSTFSTLVAQSPKLSWHA